MTSAVKRCDIVIPVYNEEENIKELHHQILAVMEGLTIDYRVIFVDDGSTDGTLDVIESLANTDHHIKFISFTRNFGHQIALIAGLEHSSGDCIITMDGDLQHPPQRIPEMVRLWASGYQVVSTVREDGESTSLLKRLTSKIFYKVINLIADVRIVPGSADFRLLDREVVKILMGFGEKNKFLRGLINWLGFRTASITYRVQRRFGGEPKYSAFRMIKFAWDGITAFSAMPLKLAFYLGLVISLCSFSYGLYAVFASFFGMTIPGWTSVVVSVLFLGGVQLMFIGMLGEYIARIFDEVKNRPLYVIKKSGL